MPYLINSFNAVLSAAVLDKSIKIEPPCAKKITGYDRSFPLREWALPPLRDFYENRAGNITAAPAHRHPLRPAKIAGSLR